MPSLRALPFLCTSTAKAEEPYFQNNLSTSSTRETPKQAHTTKDATQQNTTQTRNVYAKNHYDCEMHSMAQI